MFDSSMNATKRIIFVLPTSGLIFAQHARNNTLQLMRIKRHILVPRLMPIAKSQNKYYYLALRDAAFAECHSIFAQLTVAADQHCKEDLARH